MASTQTIYQDGPVGYGSIGFQTFLYTTTPGSTAVASYASTRGSFLIEDFTITRSVNHKMIPDEIGGDRAQYAVRKNPSATGVIQYPAASGSGNPQQGDVFSITSETEQGIEYWVIISLSRPYKNEDYWKVTATFTKAINPTTAPNFTPL
jgi:hypothetical protein